MAAAEFSSAAHLGLRCPAQVETLICLGFWGVEEFFDQAWQESLEHLHFDKGVQFLGVRSSQEWDWEHDFPKQQEVLALQEELEDIVPTAKHPAKPKGREIGNRICGASACTCLTPVPEAQTRMGTSTSGLQRNLFWPSAALTLYMYVCR